MTSYKIWAIAQSEVTWMGHEDGIPLRVSTETFSYASAFQIKDFSKFEQLTIRDDDPILDDYASGIDLRQYVAGNSHPISTNPAASNIIYSLAYKQIAELPGVGVYEIGAEALNPNSNYIMFVGIEPGQLKEGVVYNLNAYRPSPTGISYSDDLRAVAPPVAYSNIATPVCFTSGSLIATRNGARPVQELRPGDLVATMDDGLQEIRWVGSTNCGADRLLFNPKLLPIHIPAGALGVGIPSRDLLVSRQHRIYLKSKLAKNMFGESEILVPAVKLVGINGITIAYHCRDITYHHILFDKHQVVFSDGAPTESLFTGPVALQSVSRASRMEIESLFPELGQPDFSPASVRFIPKKGREIGKFVSRHASENLPFLSV